MGQLDDGEELLPNELYDIHMGLCLYLHCVSTRHHMVGKENCASTKQVSNCSPILPCAALRGLLNCWAI